MQTLTPGDPVVVELVIDNRNTGKTAYVKLTRCTDEEDFVMYNGNEYEIFYRFPSTKAIFVRSADLVVA